MSEGLRKLTRRHGMKLPVSMDYSVEECSLVVVEAVDYKSVKAPSSPNSPYVMFLD